MKVNLAFWISFLLGIKAMAQPVIIAQPTNQMVIVSNTATFNVSVSGVGPFTYQWLFNGAFVSTSGIITTFAGNIYPDFSGDGGAATNARLNGPLGLAVDAGGNLFIADLGNYRIRKVNTNEIITTVAGNGIFAESGDGGKATNASLFPYGLAVDAKGNLFIADSYNNRIRKVDTNGIITTIAGTGSYGFSGDGGAAISATLSEPLDIAIDTRGNLYISDSQNSRIRKVNTNGIITTVAGNGVLTTFGEYGFGSYSGDGGAATNAGLFFPNGVAVDAKGNIFIADYYNNRIRKVDTNGIITTIVGNGTNSFSGDGGVATNATLSSPSCVDVDAKGNLIIADSGNYRVRMVDNNNIITTVAGNGSDSSSGDGGAATSAALECGGLAVDSAGNLFIASSGYNHVLEVTRPNVPSLELTNVLTNSTGNYSVVISGAGGSVTSSIVTLTVAIPTSVTSQPQPMTVTNGHPARFVISANGWPSLAYQWQLNGTNLNGATNTTLTLQNAFSFNAGTYTVAITNAYESVTSNPALLTVLPLVITPVKLASGQFQFSFDTATGVNYAVQYSTNLTQWFPIMTLAGIGVPLTLIDPNTASNQQRFYRIILSPQ